jgi:gluconolactonase
VPVTKIALENLTKVGEGVQRPEGVVVGRDGRVWAADEASACAELKADGSVRRVGKAGGLPNGICMDVEGRILIANVGGLEGGTGPLQRLDVESGDVETLVGAIDGRDLLLSNFPVVDRQGNIWCSHSTWLVDGAEIFGDVHDGFIFRVSPDGAVAVVATGLALANGMALDADESYLYVNQTNLCNVVRFPILDGATLGEMAPYGPELGERFRDGALIEKPAAPERMSRFGAPDGNNFDQEGNLWVTLVFSNKIVAITPSGSVETVIDDPAGEVMRHPTNVSFGGDDLRDVYIGSFSSGYVLRGRSPVPGMPLVHQR